MSYLGNSAAFAANAGIVALDFNEIDFVGGGDGTLSDGLQDVAAAAGVVATAGAITANAPVAVGATVVAVVCLLAAAVVD